MLTKEQKKFLEMLKEGSKEIEEAPKRWYKNRDFILGAVKKNAFAFEYGPAKFQRDPEFFLEAVAQNAYVLQFDDIFVKHFRDEDFVKKLNVSINRYLKSLIPEGDLSDEEYEEVKATIRENIEYIEKYKAKIQSRIKEEDVQAQRKAELNDMIDSYVSKETKRDGK